MLYLLPTAHGINIPSTIMRHLAPQIDPDAKILWGNEATPENAIRAISETNPPYVFTTGHGLPCVTTLQNNTPFISLKRPDMNPKYCPSDANLTVMAGRVVHIHSCWCGRLLAPVLVEKYGAKAVFAHNDEFLFLLPPDGKTIDVTIAAPFLAEFKTDIALLSGATAGEAQDERLGAYDKWIEYFYHGEGSKLKGAPLVLRILVADKGIAAFYGDKGARVAEPSQKTFKLSLPIEVEGGSSSIAPLLIAGAVLLFGRG